MYEWVNDKLMSALWIKALYKWTIYNEKHNVSPKGWVKVWVRVSNCQLSWLPKIEVHNSVCVCLLKVTMMDQQLHFSDQSPF